MYYILCERAKKQKKFENFNSVQVGIFFRDYTVGIQTSNQSIQEISLSQHLFNTQRGTVYYIHQWIQEPCQEYSQP